MKNRTSSRTVLFLMELILAVLLFSLSSVLCIQMFMKSHTLSKNSVELNQSILWAQNVSEAFYGGNGNKELLTGLFPESTLVMINDTDYEFIISFDENFEPIHSNLISALPDSDCHYRLSASVQATDSHLLQCRIVVSDLVQSEIIYELTLHLYREKEVPYEP